MEVVPGNDKYIYSLYMEFNLEILDLADVRQFKTDAQEAFQKGVIEYRYI